MAMEVILPAHIAARFAGLYSMRKAGLYKDSYKSDHSSRNAASSLGCHDLPAASSALASVAKCCTSAGARLWSGLSTSPSDSKPQKDDRKHSSATLDHRVPKSNLLGGGREVFGQFARLGDGLETRVGCALDGRHHHGLLHKMWGRGRQSVMEYRTARDERLRGSENKPRAQSRRLGVGCPGLYKEGNARATLRREDESCSAAPLGSYGRFYMSLCAIPWWSGPRV
jgi:hypothetical protein